MPSALFFFPVLPEACKLYQQFSMGTSMGGKISWPQHFLYVQCLIETINSSSLGSINYKKLAIDKTSQNTPWFMCVVRYLLMSLSLLLLLHFQAFSCSSYSQILMLSHSYFLFVMPFSLQTWMHAVKNPGWRLMLAVVVHTGEEFRADLYYKL